MTPHWPPPLVAWILLGWTGALVVGTAVWCGSDDTATTERALEDAKVYRLPSRAGVSSMFDPGKEIRP